MLSDLPFDCMSLIFSQVSDVDLGCLSLVNKEMHKMVGGSGRKIPSVSDLALRGAIQRDYSDLQRCCPEEHRQLNRLYGNLTRIHRAEIGEHASLELSASRAKKVLGVEVTKIRPSRKMRTFYGTFDVYLIEQLVGLALYKYKNFQTMKKRRGYYAKALFS